MVVEVGAGAGVVAVVGAGCPQLARQLIPVLYGEVEVPDPEPEVYLHHVAFELTVPHVNGVVLHPLGPHTTYCGLIVQISAPVYGLPTQISEPEA